MKTVLNKYLPKEPEKNKSQRDAYEHNVAIQPLYDYLKEKEAKLRKIKLDEYSNDTVIPLKIYHQLGQADMCAEVIDLLPDCVKTPF